MGLGLGDGGGRLLHIHRGVEGGGGARGIPQAERLQHRGDQLELFGHSSRVQDEDD